MSLDLIPWAELPGRMQWAQGEHVSVLGPTGSGKTHLALSLLPSRRFVVVAGTKPKDPLLSALLRRPQRYRRVEKWPPPLPPKLMPRVLLWPQWRERKPLDTVARQSLVFGETFDGVFKAGGWALYLDEVAYFANTLGLERSLKNLWTNARSLGISVIGSTQRPAHVPLELYSQSTHVMVFRCADKRDLRRLGEIGNVDSDAMMAVVPTLGRYEFIWVDARTGTMAKSRVERR